MTIAIGIAVLLVLGVIGALVYIGLRDDEGRDPLQDRLLEFGERQTPQSLEQVELSMSFTDRVLIPLLKSLAELTSKFTPERQIEETRKRLDMAGMAGQIEPGVFFMIRVIAAILLPVLSFLIFFVFSTDMFGPVTSALITAGSAVLGYFFPSLWIASRISKRQEGIIKALPDALDLLTIAVEAGLGFDAAMGKVYEKWDNDLSIAFGRVLREIQLGKGRREALKDMSDRLGVPDVTTFIAAVIQADSLGVSIAQILRVQADQMRIKRRQRAQEKAQAAPVKMMIPLAFLIFPAIYIVLLGPAILSLIENGSGGVF